MHVPLSSRVLPEEKVQFERLCEDAGTNVSAVIRTLIRHIIEAGKVPDMQGITANPESLRLLLDVHFLVRHLSDTMDPKATLHVLSQSSRAFEKGTSTTPTSAAPTSGTPTSEGY